MSVWQGLGTGTFFLEILKEGEKRQRWNVLPLRWYAWVAGEKSESRSRQAIGCGGGYPRFRNNRSNAQVRRSQWEFDECHSCLSAIGLQLISATMKWVFWSMLNWDRVCVCFSDFFEEDIGILFIDQLLIVPSIQSLIDKSWSIRVVVSAIEPPKLLTLLTTLYCIV